MVSEKAARIITRRIKAIKNMGFEVKLDLDNKGFFLKIRKEKL